MARNVRGTAIAAAGIAASIAVSVAGPAAALDAADFHGQWGIGYAAACEEAETMIFTASGGWASTRLGDANQTEAVGTWAYGAETGLSLSFSEVLSPDRVTEAVFGAEQHDPERITLTSDLFEGGMLILHRCPG